ncbi:MAG TPA: hypothetical protein PLJ33_04565 [Peptococcaceae bacterium]|jgi:hypothetical protein|nr:hypothetical protein [Clostridia bacterium]HOB82220.1 hypothetical protein [Peptococcaceae bacterium]HPZ71343.1 hypothetical protein [Peptococcaceae bacterium]HQD54121.1 hypothetical protein [Peptococcaceae bacterium]
MEKRRERDARYLEALEEITQNLWRIREKYALDKEDNTPAAIRLKIVEEKITTERRLIEEVSLPCRFILEHFSTFLGRLDHTVGFSWGQQFELGRGTLNNIYIHEWGNVSMMIGNFRLCWRDQDYQYLFYPDKVILRSVDQSKPEIHLFFNFSFKYSKILSDFQDVVNHPQTLYCYPDLFAEEQKE